MGISIQRVYDAVSGDGVRILVDRLWPRGVRKENLRALWLKEAAPSAALRTWFNHDPEKWLEFKARYFAELDSRPEQVEKIVAFIRQGPVTLLYSARDKEHNQAAALREYLERKS